MSISVLAQAVNITHLINATCTVPGIAPADLQVFTSTVSEPASSLQLIQYVAG